MYVYDSKEGMFVGMFACVFRDFHVFNLQIKSRVHTN